MQEKTAFCVRFAEKSLISEFLLTFYKNSLKINNAFKLKSNSLITYKMILSSAVHFGFDEIGDYGINNIFKYNGLKIYNYEKYIADIACGRSGMVLAKFDGENFYRDDRKRIFAFDGESIKAYTLEDNEIVEEEFAYIHFQKRKMNVRTNDCSKFLILPDGFYEYRTDYKNIIISQHYNEIYWKYKKLKFSIMALKKRIIRNKEIKKIITNNKL